jgi:hypothetical protein
LSYTRQYGARIGGGQHCTPFVPNCNMSDEIVVAISDEMVVVTCFHSDFLIYNFYYETIGIYIILSRYIIKAYISIKE